MTIQNHSQINVCFWNSLPNEIQKHIFSFAILDAIPLWEKYDRLSSLKLVSKTFRQNTKPLIEDLLKYKKKLIEKMRKKYKIDPSTPSEGILFAIFVAGCNPRKCNIWSEKNAKRNLVNVYELIAWPEQRTFNKGCYRKFYKTPPLVTACCNEFIPKSIINKLLDSGEGYDAMISTRMDLHGRRSISIKRFINRYAVYLSKKRRQDLQSIFSLHAAKHRKQKKFNLTKRILSISKYKLK